MKIIETFIVFVDGRYTKLYQTISQDGTPKFYIERLINIYGHIGIFEPTSKELDQIKFL